MLLNRLEKYSNANANPANVANVHPQNTPTLATLATLQLATRIESEVISNWWLIHFTDLKPVQVAMWPPCNHAGAMASYPKAVAAEPTPSPFEDTLTYDPIKLLEMVRLGCYTIEVKGDVLIVSPAFSIDDEMANLIRVHNADLIKLLESEI